MKFIALAAASLALSHALKIEQRGIWDDAIGGVDQKEYNKEAPKEYKEVEKPKIDYAAIERKKLLAEQAKEKEALKVKEREQQKEDMEIYLLTFCKTLKPEEF